MSLLWTLRKWVDPEQAAEEEARRRQRETLLPQAEDGGGAPPERVVARAPRAMRCRICGHRGEDTELCPHCLAGTMQPV